jgi:hypothetical protein
MRPANEAVPDACWRVFVADGVAGVAVARADGIADGFLDAAEAVEVPVAEGEFVAEPELELVADGSVAALPASDFTSSSSFWPGRSTRARETTMSTAAVDRNSHRLDTGPP